MASIETRKGKAGTSYRIKWRLAGQWQSETLPNRAAAATFKQAVEDTGGHWPTEWDRINRRWKPAGAVEGATVVTVDAWAKEWVESLSGIAERTRHDYARDIRLHISPTFGPMRIDEVTKQDVARWVNRLQRDTKAPKTIANLHGTLYTLMRDAADAGLRTGNPCARTRLPRSDNLTNDDQVFLTPSEIQLVLSHVPEPARTLFAVMAGTGLRWGEASALQVGDVDLLANPPSVRVQRAWVRLPEGGRELGPPKTRRSRRTVPLPPYLVEMLIPLTQRPAEEFLLTAPQGGPWHYTPAYRVWTKAVLDARRCDLHRRLPKADGPCDPRVCVGVLDKQPSIKALRHSYASLLVAQNIPITLIQRRMGHESIKTTSDTYSHLAPELDNRVVDAVQDALGAAVAAL